VNHVGGGLNIGGSLKLKAWPRIGVLVNQLRWIIFHSRVRKKAYSSSIVAGFWIQN
jgi:hypothetical protein